MNRLSTAVLLGVLLCAARPAAAATYVVPSDAELVARADAIVVARALKSRTVAAGAGKIETIFELRVVKVVKGALAAGQKVALVEEGGSLAGRFELVVGGPRYVEGRDYLVFITQDAEGEYRTLGLGLGQFMFEVDGSGMQYLTRPAGICGFDGNLAPYVEQDRDARRFVEFIQAAARGELAAADYRYRGSNVSPQNDEVRAMTFSRNSYLMQVTLDDGTPAGGLRWRSPRYGFEVVNATPAEEAVAQRAADVWAGAGDSTISIIASPSINDSLPGATPDAPDSKNVIRLSDATIASAGLARLYGQDVYSFEGESFVSLAEVDISIAPPYGMCSEVLAHEIGHSLGFRHSNQDCTPASECTTDALMRPVVTCDDSALRAWEIHAASTVYGTGGIPCISPAITAHPQDATMSAGEAVSLSVTATGSSPMYQWYSGPKDDTSVPVQSRTGATLLVAPTSTTSYWVKVSNACGSASSNAATVTVLPCATVSISAPVVTSLGGSGYQLAVTASGGTIASIEWFTGTDPGAAGTFLGTGSVIDVSPAQPTSYWARASNSCGNRAYSSVVTIEPAAACTPPAIITPPASITVRGGEKATLGVSASGTAPLSYAWYEGPAGDTTKKVGSSATLTSGRILLATKFWVRVTNACGAADSDAATVSVTPARLRVVRR